MLRSITRRLPIIHGVLAVIVVAACGLANALPVAAASQRQVQISNFAFQPRTLTVQAGDTVTWTNADDAPHSVTADKGSFASGTIDEGASFAFTFQQPGTYTYRCDFHPEMRGTIVVRAAAVAPSQAAGSSTPRSNHAGPGSGHGDQPDTAMPLPSSIPSVSFVLWGMGLLLMGISLLPFAASRAVDQRQSLGGWRR